MAAIPGQPEQCPTRLSLTPEQLRATTAAVPQADVIHNIHCIQIHLNTYRHIQILTNTDPKHKPWLARALAAALSKANMIFQVNGILI